VLVFWGRCASVWRGRGAWDGSTIGLARRCVTPRCAALLCPAARRRWRNTVSEQGAAAGPAGVTREARQLVTMSAADMFALDPEDDEGFVDERQARQQATRQQAAAEQVLEVQLQQQSQETRR